MTRELLSSPINPDRFLSVQPESSGDGSLLSLYTLQEDGQLELLSKGSLPGFLRSVAWHPTSESLLAVGFVSGRVQLSSPQPDSVAGAELGSARHPRQALSLAWNPNHAHWLAAGFERHRTDKGLLIWDLHESVSSLNETPSISSLMRRRKGTEAGGGGGGARTIFELAQGDSAHSALWLKHSSRTLAVGLSGKYIRVFDLRSDPNRHQLSVPSKAVHGLAQSPNQEHQVLSYADNQLFVWDLRGGKAERPLLSISESKPIIQAQWDPTGKDVLSVLCRGWDMIRTYQLQRMMGEDMELAYTEQHFVPLFTDLDTGVGNPEQLAGFSWHSQRDSTLVAFSVAGNVAAQQVHSRVCVDWAPDNGLLASFGSCLFAVDEPASLEDISETMLRRASNGRLGRPAPGGGQGWDPAAPDPVAWAWDWLDRAKGQQLAPRAAGAWDIIRRAKSDSISEFNSISTEARTTPPLQMYRSRERGLVRRLCGWEMSVPAASSRSALISLVTLDLSAAVQTLMRLELHTAKAVGMAAAGWGSGGAEGGKEWRQAASALLSGTSDAYLKGCLLFLLGLSREGGSEGLQALMRVEELPVFDRAVIGALHLADAAFHDWLREAAEAAAASGSLLGLVLTGVDSEGHSLRLMQSYVDATGDVQTAALLLMHSGAIPAKAVGIGRTSWSLGASWAAEDSQDSQAWRIVEAYLELLNQWRLWHVRAQTEALLAVLPATPAPSGVGLVELGAALPPQISLCCTFCGRSVGGRAGRRLRPVAAKLSVCPHCRKPLPRCAVCRRHVGAPLPPPASHDSCSEGSKQPPVDRSNRLGGWFTWCQSCRHGGHSRHVEQWFAASTECPVNGCACRCSQLDVSASEVPSLA